MPGGTSGWKCARFAGDRRRPALFGGGGPGQSLLALHKKTGKWSGRATMKRITHSTPRGGHDPRPAAGDLLPPERTVFGCRAGRQESCGVPPRVQGFHGDFPGRLRRHRLFGRLRRGQRGLQNQQGRRSIPATELWRIHGDSKWPTTGARRSARTAICMACSASRSGGRPAEVRGTRHRQDPMGTAGLRRRQCDPRSDKILALADDGRVVVVEATPAGLQGDRPAKRWTASAGPPPP